MKIKDFVKMWEESNGVEEVLLVTQKKHPDGIHDHLYHVLYSYVQGNNGRHEAIRVRIGKRGKVLEHEIFNLHGDDWGKEDAVLDPNNNYLQNINIWFNTWSNDYTSSVSIIDTVSSSTTASISWTGGYI